MRLHILRPFLIAILLSGAATPKALGQRIYDKDKDDQAQAASKLAGEATSGSVFDKQLKNLKLITQQDFATYFMAAKRQMNLDINSFITWGEVASAVSRVRGDVGRRDPYQGKDVNAIRAELKRSRDDAAAKLKELQQKIKAPDDPDVPVMFERLGELQTLVGLADNLLERSQNAANSDENKTLRVGIGEVGQALDALKNLYSTYLTKMDEIDQASRDIEALKVPMQKVALARLQVEEEHWKTVGAIQARRAADEADVIHLLADFEASVIKLHLANSLDDLKNVSIPVEDTLNDLISATTDARSNRQDDQENLRKALVKTREAEANLALTTKALENARKSGSQRAIAQAWKELTNAHQAVEQCKATAGALRSSLKTNSDQISQSRKRLAHILDVLYVASALAAHGSTPANLEALRLAQEEHRYSIRKSAVLAKAYEATILSGTQRLALYYKGGLKPEKIAQLIHSAATAAIPVAILSK